MKTVNFSSLLNASDLVWMHRCSPFSMCFHPYSAIIKIRKCWCGNLLCCRNYRGFFPAMFFWLDPKNSRVFGSQPTCRLFNSSFCNNSFCIYIQYIAMFSVSLSMSKYWVPSPLAFDNKHRCSDTQKGVAWKNQEITSLLLPLFRWWLAFYFITRRLWGSCCVNWGWGLATVIQSPPTKGLSNVCTGFSAMLLRPQFHLK